MLKVDTNIRYNLHKNDELDKEMKGKSMENYQKRMEMIVTNLESVGKLPSLLLQCCCAPCSSAVLERLCEHFNITLFFFNPNIEPESEYQKRLLELQNFVDRIPFHNIERIIEGRYIPQEFYERIKGLEHTGERGKRCYQCYSLRLEETAQVAKKNQFDYFTTTLTLSPHKDAVWLNEIGLLMQDKYNINYLVSDFKKKSGYQRSIELSKEYGLYRQDYCGCVYSKNERNIQKGEEK